MKKKCGVGKGSGAGEGGEDGLRAPLAFRRRPREKDRSSGIWLGKG